MRSSFLSLFAAVIVSRISTQKTLSEECQTKLALAPARDGHFYAGQFGIAAIKDGSCDLRRLNPGSDNFIAMDEHGRKIFHTPDLEGYWSADDWTLLFGPASISTSGSGKLYELPKYEEERKNWLGGIDQEGWVTSYPYSGDQFQRFYPARFTAVGEIVHIPHKQLDILLQTYKYETMEGKTRSAIAAQLRLNCMKMEFVTWQEPEQLVSRQASMRAFLEGIALEDVNATPELISKACTPRGTRPIRMAIPRLRH